jgi:cellulose/xylan binding protein with CBM9 domain/F5/8 type C domain-containing protein
MISIRNTIFTACLFTAILSFAAQPDYGGIVLKSSKKIILPQADTPIRTSVSFPACPEKKGDAVYLYFNAWMPKYGGWLSILGIEINGKRLGKFNSVKKVRLLNRIGKMQTTLARRKYFDWWNGEKLLLFFGAKDKVDKRIIYPRAEGTGYLLDITDIVNSDKKNNLTFINYLTTKVYKDNKKRVIAVDDLQIGYMSNKTVAKLRGENSGKKQTIKLNQLPNAPKIDAIIKKKEWINAYSTKLQNIRGGKLKNPATVYIGYDNENLYFALQCFEKDMNKLKTLFTHTEEHDNSIWQDDCVEVFLAPYGNKKDYYHVIINAAGITYDAFAGNTAWESSMRKAVRKDENSWTVECAIPLRSLDANLQAGDTWGINVGREEKPSAELSSINPGAGNFSKNLIPVQFGTPENGISLAAINFKKSSKLKLNIRNSKKQPGKYYIKINVKGSKEKNFTTQKEVLVKANSQIEVEIPYPKIRVPKTVELTVTDENDKQLYHNKAEIPVDLNISFRAWQVKNPLYKELLPEKTSLPVRSFMWTHDTHVSKLTNQGLQYGFSYSKAKVLKDAERDRLIYITNPSMVKASGSIDNLVMPFYRYANAPKINKRTFLPDPVVTASYLKSAKQVIAERKPNHIWGISMGDETGEITINTGVLLFEKMRNQYDYIRNLDAEIKKNYGGGKWGIPHSRNDHTPGRWIAYYQFISINLANLMHTTYKIVKKQAPELKLVTYDPVDLSNAYDYALWRGSFDIATMQLYPKSNPFTTEFAQGVKKIRDLSGAKDVRPVAHVEHYANNFTLEETLALLSQAVRGGANGWHYYIADTIGLRGGGAKYLTSDTFGAPERARLMMTVAQNTPKLKYPESDCALFSSNITNWSRHERRSQSEGAAFTLLGQNAGVWFDFINETIIKKMPEKLKKYRVIFVYDAEYETQAAVKALKNYVQKGGTLVVFDPKAFSKNRYAADSTAAQLDLFGVSVGKNLKNTNFISGGINYKPNARLYKIKPGSGCRVLASFADGNPAVIERKQGKGKIHIFAFNPCSLRSLRSKKWRKYFHQYAKQLGLKTDQKIWRFSFPNSLIKKLPEPQGMCLTNNHILWRLFTPVSSYNQTTAGTYSYSRKPDKIVDQGGIKNISFSKGDLTNRRKAPSAGNVDLGKSKMSTWVVAFYTNKAMSIVFDMKKIYPINRVELFYQGLLPAMEISVSQDGKTWDSFKVPSELENKNLIRDVKQKVIALKGNPNARYVKVKFKTSKSKQLLTLSEIEIWTK